MKKINVGINGLGRIGRHLFRLFSLDNNINIKAINDINPDLKNWIYTINYDSIYGRNNFPLRIQKGVLELNEKKISTFNKKNIEDVPWAECGVDYIVESSGVSSNVLGSKIILNNKKVKQILVTNCSDVVDFTMVLGVNENHFNPQNHKLISSNICDATAIAPIMKLINDLYTIQTGSITTLHPWLTYQNLMDGASKSVSNPGEIYHHYAIGRSAIRNIIPKPTSALDAVIKVLPQLDINTFSSMSFRTPTEIVGSADITLIAEKQISRNQILNELEKYEENQKFPVLKLIEEPLVSLDFLGEKYSAIVDIRWLKVINKNLIKFVLWYDNEYGYSCNVLRQLKYINKVDS